MRLGVPRFLARAPRLRFRSPGTRDGRSAGDRPGCAGAGRPCVGSSPPDPCLAYQRRRVCGNIGGGIGHAPPHPEPAAAAPGHDVFESKSGSGALRLLGRWVLAGAAQTRASGYLSSSSRGPTPRTRSTRGRRSPPNALPCRGESSPVSGAGRRQGTSEKLTSARLAQEIFRGSPKAALPRQRLLSTENGANGKGRRMAPPARISSPPPVPSGRHLEP